MPNNNQKIGLVIDDVCPLPEEIIKRYQIEVVKTKIFFPEWERFPEKNLYQVMKETKATPKTSAPSPGDFLKAYKKALQKFEKILVITVSSKLSAVYNSAYQAKEFLPDPAKIIIFDSLVASVPEGLLSLEAAKLIKEGKNVEEIIKTLENLREKAKLLGFLGTTYWIERCGRMTHWQGIAFKILKGLGIQPMIGFKKGKVGLTGFNFGTRDIFKAAFCQLKLQTKKYGKLKAGINYTDNIALSYKLKEKVERGLGAEVLFISSVPPIVGANTGPGTLLVGCIPK